MRDPGRKQNGIINPFYNLIGLGGNIFRYPFVLPVTGFCNGIPDPRSHIIKLAVKTKSYRIIKSMAAIAYDMLFGFLISLMQKCQCRTDRKLRIDGSTKKLFLLQECITEILVVTAV